MSKNVSKLINFGWICCYYPSSIHLGKVSSSLVPSPIFMKPHYLSRYIRHSPGQNWGSCGGQHYTIIVRWYDFELRFFVRLHRFTYFCCRLYVLPLTKDIFYFFILILQSLLFTFLFLNYYLKNGYFRSDLKATTLHDKVPTFEVRARIWCFRVNLVMAEKRNNLLTLLVTTPWPYPVL